jgi:hypothetical protein
MKAKSENASNIWMVKAAQSIKLIKNITEGLLDWELNLGIRNLTCLQAYNCPLCFSRMTSENPPLPRLFSLRECINIG